MTSMVKVFFVGDVATLEVSTGLLPATQSIEWSHSFDGCKATHNVSHR